MLGNIQPLAGNWYIDDAQHDVFSLIKKYSAPQVSEKEYHEGTKHFAEHMLGSVGIVCASNTTCLQDIECQEVARWHHHNNAHSNWRNRHPHILKVYREYIDAKEKEAAPADTSVQAQALRKYRIAEIGIAHGGLSHAMVSNLVQDRLKGGSLPKYEIEYHGIDPFVGSYDDKGDQFSKLLHNKNTTRWAEAILHNMVEFGCQFKLHHKPSLLGARDFEDLSLDVVFLDGDHTYEAVVYDIHAWLPKVKVGGLLCFDDFSWFFPGVVRAATEFSLCHNSVLLPMYDSNGNVYLRKTHEHMPVVAANVTLFGEYGISCHVYTFDNAR